MKIIDITRGLFSSPVYPGDPKPAAHQIRSIENGDECRLSAIFACTHTGTHIDAPSHYLEKGAGIEKLPLENYIGECTVITTGGMVTGAEMEEIVENAKPRILLRSKGSVRLSESAAYVLGESGVLLVGVDALSVSDDDNNRRVHVQLLKSGVGILEGLLLDGVHDGDYFLFAPPVLLEGLDGAPSRAVLIKF